MLLNKSVYRRLSNAFDYSGLSKIVQCFGIKLFIEDYSIALNKAVYRRLFNSFE